LSINKKQIIKKLKEIQEPCLPIIDIVDMGLIYDIKIDSNNVYVLMTFTTPLCPSGVRLVRKVKDKLLEIDGIGKVDVDLTFDPLWTKDRLTKENQIKLGYI
jgi:metal-sulfur cluster biosynthetic enzyme